MVIVHFNRPSTTFIRVYDDMKREVASANLRKEIEKDEGEGPVATGGSRRRHRQREGPGGEREDEGTGRSGSTNRGGPSEPSLRLRQNPVRVGRRRKKSIVQGRFVVEGEQVSPEETAFSVRVSPSWVRVEELPGSGNVVKEDVCRRGRRRSV